MLYYLYKIGRFLALRLPLVACYAIAVVAADIYYRFAKDDRKSLEANLRIVLETTDKKTINRHIKMVFRNFAKYLADFFRFTGLSKDYLLSHINIEGKENLDKALAKGKGAILVGAHLGNWELGAAVIASLGYPFHAIVLDHSDKRINDFFIKQRAICDVKVIHIGFQLKNCFRVLKKNHLLAIVGDRDFTNHGVKVDFFGVPATLPKGPAFFSLRTDAPIIPTFSIRTKKDTFRIIMEEPLENKNTGDTQADTKNIMRKYVSVIERYVKSFPGQWYAFRRIW